MFGQRKHLRIRIVSFSALSLAMACTATCWGQTTDPFSTADRSTPDPIASTIPTAIANTSSTGQPAETRPREPAPSITANNTATERALDRLANVNYLENRFADILHELSGDWAVTFALHESAREYNLDEDTLITMKLQCRASTLLDTMLGDHDCTYAVKDGIVFILSTDMALEDQWRELRDFDCQNLVTNQFAGDGQRLTAFLQQMVDPESWEVNGGAARIEDVNGKLFVSQTSINMRKLAHILERLEQRP